VSDIQSALILAGPGEPARTIDRAGSLYAPAWSPDGKVLTVLSPGAVDAYAPDGRHVWNQTSGGSPPAGWSRLGLFAAGIVDGKLTTYDSRGTRVFTTRADAASWSPDGAHLAVFVGRRLRVLTTAGRVVFTVPKGLDGSLPDWASNDDVISGAAGTGRPVTVSIRTGRVSPFDGVPYVIAHSNDGKLTATVVRRGAAFAVRVAGSVIGTVPGCWEDGSFEPAVTAPQFTPDDRSLVYQSYCGEPWSNLWSVSADGSLERRLTSTAAEQTEPALSPDGTEIVYSQSPHTGLSCKGCPQLLNVAAADGSHAKALTSGTDGNFDSDATWSPDGTHILFRHSTFDTSDLWEIAAVGGSPTDLHISGESPAWGPSRIAYVNGSVTPIALMTAAPDGTDRKRVASGLVTAPAWSRDGRLAWLRTTVNGNRWWLFVETSSGTTHFLLPFSNVRDLAWSPGGSRLAIVAKSATTATSDVYTMSTTGSDIRRVTQNADAFDVNWG
jgi:Tol biopolymer transport system component